MKQLTREEFVTKGQKNGGITIVIEEDEKTIVKK
jgi:hypothetical protein